MSEIDAMISLHCGSMAASAERLKAYLESRGLNVWVCTQMSGGENYRDSIVDAIDKAEVVIIMLNQEWALSGECQDEYNYAKRLNLTSYESGRSERGHPRLPVFCPIVFKNLDWNEHKHVRLLSANTNFIVHDGDDLASPTSAKAQKTFEAVAASLAASAGKKLKEVGQEETKKPAAPSKGEIKLGKNYLGNTLSEIRLTSRIYPGGMVKELQAYYSISFSNLVHDEATGEVTLDATRSREGFEWSECAHLNLGDDVKKELSGHFKETFTGQGKGKYNKTQKRLTLTVEKWTPNRQGFSWGKENFNLAAVKEGELIGFCACNGTIVMKEF